MQNKQSAAYVRGYAAGLIKSGSVEKCERQNARLLKIAVLLQKRAGVWDYERAEKKPGSPEFMKIVNKKVQDMAASQMDAPEYSPEHEAGKSLQQAKLTATGIKGPAMQDVKKRYERGAPERERRRKERDKPLEVDVPDRDEKQKGEAGKPAPTLQDRETAFNVGSPEDRFNRQQRLWYQMLGMSPAQLSAEQELTQQAKARSALHQQRLNWIRSLFGAR
jgi:hypothetical protein